MDSGSETLKRLKQKKCRICLSEQNLTPLFRRGLGLKVMQLADIKIYEGDGLPTTICMDCELEVKRCHNFVAQIKRADAKLREMLENGEDSSEISEKEREVVGSNDSEVSDCQIDIEECNVKQEAYPFDHLIDEKAEIHSNSDNDHLYETEDNNDQMEDETEFNQINHVDVVECSDTMATEGMEVSEDPLGEESLIDTQKSLKTECETTADPLTCMKQENLESMDVDKGTSVAATLSPQPLIAAPPTPQPSTSSSVENVIVECDEESFPYLSGHCKIKKDDSSVNSETEFVVQKIKKNNKNKGNNKNLHNKRYRERKIKEGNDEYSKELARKRSKKYRDKKRHLNEINNETCTEESTADNNIRVTKQPTFNNQSNFGDTLIRIHHSQIEGLLWLNVPNIQINEGNHCISKLSVPSNNVNNKLNKNLQQEEKKNEKTENDRKKELSNLRYKLYRERIKKEGRDEHSKALSRERTKRYREKQRLLRLLNNETDPGQTYI